MPIAKVIYRVIRQISSDERHGIECANAAKSSASRRFQFQFQNRLLSVRAVRSTPSHVNTRPVIAVAPIPARTVAPSAAVPMSVPIVPAIAMPIVVTIIECRTYGDTGDQRNSDQRSRSAEIIGITAGGSLAKCQIARRCPTIGRAVADLTPAIAGCAAAYGYGRATGDRPQRRIACSGACADIEVGGGYGVRRRAAPAANTPRATRAALRASFIGVLPELSLLHMKRSR